MIALVTTGEVSEVAEFLERLGATVRHGSVSQPLLDLAAREAPADPEPDPNAEPAPTDDLDRQPEPKV